jgi:hypothetical protein
MGILIILIYVPLESPWTSPNSLTAQTKPKWFLENAFVPLFSAGAGNIVTYNFMDVPLVPKSAKLVTLGALGVVAIRPPLGRFTESGSAL